MDNDLTLSQFVDNSIDYLRNDMRLVFLPGIYSLESELVVKNVHSFSTFVDSTSSLKATIICGANGRFALILAMLVLY